MSSSAGVHARPGSGDLGERVLEAATNRLLFRGARRLRTAEIAELAGTTESTLFRHFDGLEDVLGQAYARSWRMINEEIAAAAFERAGAGDPTTQLLGDTQALWNMRRERDLAEAATLAFLFFRRRAQILGPDSEPAEEEVRFRNRLDNLTDAIADQEEAEVDGRVLSTYIMNYAASVWLTWFALPADDERGEHDLTAHEAQLGVIVVRDRWRSPEEAERELEERGVGSS